VIGVLQRSTDIAGRVLLAEDNLVSQRVAEAMLQSLGFHVDVVGDGAEAVKAASTKPYRAILMDCQIPILDGYQATAQIRHLEGVRRHTPIIAVTGLAARSNQERCRAAGMDDFVAKPLTPSGLTDLLAHWVPDGSLPSIAIDPAGPPPDWHLHLDHAHESTRPALDPHMVARLDWLGATAGEDLVGRLTVDFAADAVTHVDALRRAMAREDAVAVSRVARTLGATSVNLGATHLARLCDGLVAENPGAIAAGDVRRGWALILLLETELVRVHAALRVLRARP
jgi:two-component system sensor histidine kinase/response regulator